MTQIRFRGRLAELALIVSVAIVPLSLIGCASSSTSQQPSLVVDPDTAATLNIYRPNNGAVGAAVRYYAYLDGSRLCRLSSEEAHTIQVPPGKHELYIQSEFLGALSGAKNPVLPVEFQPKTEYFARFSIALGNVAVIGTAVSASSSRSLTLVDRETWESRR